MLVTETLFGTVDKVQIAIERLQQFEPPEGYYVAFSGGKDSVVVKRLVEMAGVKADYHYNLTTVDPPELVKFIKEKHPEVIRERPEKTMWQTIVDEETPPTRLIRYCCRILKEHGGAGRLCITGIRWAESARRNKRMMVETCRQDSTKTFLHPIIDWTNEDIWRFIKNNQIAYCRLYDEGFKRLGCIMCPQGDTKQMLRDAARWPKYYKNYLRAFDKMLKKMKLHREDIRWQTAQDVMDWWIYNPPKGDEDQCVLFE